MLVLLAFPVSSTANTLEPPQGTLSMVADITAATQSSQPNFQYAFAEGFLFTTIDEQAKSVLRYSDGTTAGTQVLYQGASGYFVGLKEQSLFIAYSGGSSWLSITDGTPAGTQLFFDFQDNFVSIAAAAEIGDWLYFLVSGGAGTHLWRTDGTQPNTAQLVTGLSFNEYTEVEPELAAFNNSLYFNARSSTSGFELWRIPAAGSAVIGPPELVKDICQGSCGRPNQGDASPHFFTRMGNNLYFAASDAAHGQEIWATDGTPEGTVLVRDINPGVNGSQPGELTAAGFRLFFTATNGVEGERVWQTNGPAGVTSPVIIVPGSTFSAPHGLTALEGNLFLAAKEDSYGVELWRVDGVTLSTGRIDIAAGRTSGGPALLTAVQERLFFSAQSQDGDRELWLWDESAQAARLVKDIVPGADGSSPRDLHAWGDRLVFSAVDPLHDRELWLSDGTAAGTVLLADLNPLPSQQGSAPDQFRSFSGMTLFTAADPLHGRELWHTQGTPQTTWLLKDFIPGPSDSYLNPEDMVEQDGVIFFTATDTTSYDPPRPEEVREYGAELWRTDGTPGGTWMVKDLRPGLAASFPNHFARMGGKVYFFADDGEHGSVLWRTDGTSTGTVPVSTQSAVDPSKIQVAVLGDLLIYSSPNTPSYGYFTQYRSDGTAAGTGPFVTNWIPTDNYTAQFFLPFQGNVYQGYRSQNNPTDLFWMTDGTADGTAAVLFPGVDLVRTPDALVPLGNALYFVAATRRGAFDGYSLWKLPAGSHTAEWVMDLAGVTQAKAAVAVGPDRFVFLAGDSSTATWWKSDGTPGGTGVICPGCSFENIGSMTTWRKHLFFTNDSGTGSEIWLTDGSASGTMRLAEIEPGVVPENPLHLYGGTRGLYFNASFLGFGPEPWVYALDLDERVFLPVTRR